MLYKNYGIIIVRIELKKNLCFRCMSNHFILQLKDEVFFLVVFFSSLCLPTRKCNAAGLCLP